MDSSWSPGLGETLQGESVRQTVKIQANKESEWSCEKAETGGVGQGSVLGHVAGGGGRGRTEAFLWVSSRWEGSVW